MFNIFSSVNKEVVISRYSQLTFWLAKFLPSCTTITMRIINFVHSFFRFFLRLAKMFLYRLLSSGFTWFQRTQLVPQSDLNCWCWWATLGLFLHNKACKRVRDQIKICKVLILTIKLEFKSSITAIINAVKTTHLSVMFLLQ